MNSSSPRLWSMCMTGILCCVFFAPSAGRGQAVADKREKYPAKLQVYALQHASADTVSDVLMTLMADMEMRISADARTNRLIVHGSEAIHSRVASLIQTLDAAPELVILPSKDESKSTAIRDILQQLDFEVDVAMDPALGTIILRGSKDAVERAQEVIRHLEVLIAGGAADQGERQYSVEFFAVTSGTANDPAALQTLETDDLGNVDAALRKKGIDHPILLAKSEIAALAQSPFSASDTAFAQVSGTVEPASNGVRLEIEIEMATEDRPVSFRTTILTKLDHPIVFASTQPKAGEARTYVLVVRVREI